MIELQHLTKRFATKAGTLVALQDISLTIQDGDIFGIIGMSGAGKSTLVRCINMLEKPDEGSVIVNGRRMETLDARGLREARREIAMIFQQFNLLMQRNCLKNVCFPMELAGVPKEKAEARARELLELVGLPDKAESYPAQLSGGQKQRVAIARALATDPKVLLCDEATSALDPNTTHAILQLIQNINKELGITVVIITHQMSVVEQVCQNVAILDAGKVVEQGSVAEIFSNPKTPAARRLVFPARRRPAVWSSRPARPRANCPPVTVWSGWPSTVPRPPTSLWWPVWPSSAGPWSPSWRRTPVSSTARPWAACSWLCPITPMRPKRPSPISAPIPV